MKLIGLEEHFVTAPVVKAWRSTEGRWRDPAVDSSEGEWERKLMDLGPERLAAMDDSGLDVQVLSLTTPGVHSLEPVEAVALQRETNDLLAETVRGSDRFQGFATLATPAPESAAQELERAVRKLGLQGAMLFGHTRERNIDHRDFWPIFEAANDLRAPLYLHPQTPVPEVREAYYTGLGDAVDSMFMRAGIGWHYETGIQILRMILAGVFDRYPDLQIVTGHWGEVFLFYLERIDMLNRFAKLPLRISEYVRRNVMITPSGIFSQRYFRWAIDVIGADRILYSTDYPFVPAAGGEARRFLEEAELTSDDKEKIAFRNWERLCAGIRR